MARNMPQWDFSRKSDQASLDEQYENSDYIFKKQLASFIQ